MRKSIALVILVSMVVLSACSSYICPTYSKAPQPVNTEEANV